MKEKFKSIVKKLKPNRAVYITALTLILSLSVIIAVSVATNRSKKNQIPKSTSSSPVTTTSPVTKAPDVTNAPETTKAPETTIPQSPVNEPVVLSLPVSGVLRTVHDDALQVWSATMRDYRVHLGIDIAAEDNAPVYAAADGKVAQVWNDVKLGNCVSIQHSDDTFTFYKNLSAELPDGIEAGALVKAGQIIGNVGRTAMTEVADEPHLHLEMTVGGKQVDPLEYFDRSAVASINVDKFE